MWSASVFIGFGAEMEETLLKIIGRIRRSERLRVFLISKIVLNRSHTPKQQNPRINQIKILKLNKMLIIERTHEIEHKNHNVFLGLGKSTNLLYLFWQKNDS